MAEIFFTSDSHFNHVNILKFTGDDGNLIRPGFKDVNHMNQTMVHNWNKIVHPQDKVYHLGDVYLGNQNAALDILRQLNGHKRLVLGNHDDAATRPLNLCFEKITLWRIFKEHNFMCSHVPQRKDRFRYCEYNVHGHTHQNKVLYDPQGSREDPTYINICVEQTDFTPVHLDQIIQMIKDRK